MLQLKQTALAVCANNYYWSTTESDNSNAWFQYFLDGFQYFDDKGNPIYVRAVRAF